jgi:hypothetical protein
MPFTRRDLTHLAPMLAGRSTAGDTMRLGEPAPVDPFGLREAVRASTSRLSDSASASLVAVG